MLAARERAAGGTARAALLRGPEAPTPATSTAPPPPDAQPIVAAIAPVVAAEPTPAETGVADMDTLARLREAKRRRDRQ
jgi:hypothetical protein